MTDTYIVWAVIIIALLVIAKIKFSSSNEKRNVFKNNKYSYITKSLIMSKAEADFFSTLNFAVQERYYVFPQVHLSALLDHKVKGQDWNFAFRHINGKSVDYVLCDKISLKPVYAIELDDYTHERHDRIERDAEVERIFYQAQLPLVRFSNKNVSQAEIVSALMNANAILR